MTALLDDRLNKFAYAYLASCWVLASIVFYSSYRRTDMPLRRQQLKWLTRGTVLAVTPFTLLYIVPYLADVPVPGLFEKLAAISLLVLPLTFSWAIVRYRLMDVDLIFKRGVTYTLATASGLFGLYFGSHRAPAIGTHPADPPSAPSGPHHRHHPRRPALRPAGTRIQARVDRVFDRKRLDYRETLIDFGRGLNSQTDLRAARCHRLQAAADPSGDAGRGVSGSEEGP